MYLKDESLYISGLFKMASSCSKKIGYSYATAACFKPKNFIDGFKDFYQIKEDVKLKKSNITYTKLLERIFGKNKRIIEGLIHWTTFNSGEVLNIYTINNNIIESLGGGEKGLSPFYFCDNVYFIELKKLVICVLIGNDE